MIKKIEKYEKLVNKYEKKIKLLIFWLLSIIQKKINIFFLNITQKLFFFNIYPKI